MKMGEDTAAMIRALFRRSSVNRIAEHPIRMARTELFDKFVGLPEHVLRMTNIVSSKFVGVQKNGFGHRLRQDTKLAVTLGHGFKSSAVQQTAYRNKELFALFDGQLCDV